MFLKEDKITRYLKDLKANLNLREKSIPQFTVYPAELTKKTIPNFEDLSGQVFKIASSWGGKNICRWFRTEITIPVQWKDQGNIYLEIIPGAGHSGNLAGAESLLYLNRQPVQGLDRNHFLLKLSSQDLSQNKLEILIKAFSGLETVQHNFKIAKIICRSKAGEEFYQLANTTLAALKTMNSNNQLKAKVLNTLNHSINLIDFRQPGSTAFFASLVKALEYLRGSLKELKAAESKSLPTITAVGHSHIDVAWLWRLLHTREKCARTFSTVLRLMDEYPDYTYLQSTPQLYQFIKEDYPEIYAKIKEKIAAGRWEVTGGMWVEADCNLSSGESLVRQFLQGYNFIKKEFGVDWNILWLPDVFGYSWALPQLIKKSGLKYFMTTKISWSQFNRPEYDTFSWRGIDGTEVLTHFITTPELEQESPYYTYNGILNPESVAGIWSNYRQQDINNNLLLAFGWGDGGGGPTRKMIESGLKMQEVPGLPTIKFGQAESYFKKLADQLADKSDLPVWDGELYLEYHRGTYTSQAEIKKNNRKAEIALHDAELFNSFAFIADYCPYQQEIINKSWQTVLKNQFHDILPGSSIKEVYQDSRAEFAAVFANTDQVLKNSLREIAARIAGPAKKLVVFNSLNWVRNAYLTVGDQEYLIKDIPANGYLAFKMTAGEIKDPANYPELEPVKTRSANRFLKIAGNSFENKFYRLTVNQLGQLSSIYDKEFERELIPAGQVANHLQAFEDRPLQYNAWDIDIYYQEKEYTIDKLEKMEAAIRGDKIIIDFSWKFLDSTINQQLLLYADQRRIDFKTEIDWQQEQILLKTAFPVDLRATSADYEIQFGNVSRPTHWNTSWDYAKFETVGHKWADLSERDYGVSLLNDCKYGYDIKDQVLRLTLLKSGVYPDPTADQGQHNFVYSLYPHPGDWFIGKTVQAAYQLNYPIKKVVTTAAAGQAERKKSLLELETESTIMETVKKAENSSDIILRFYEYGNRRDQVKVKFDFEFKEIRLCNLIETEQGEVLKQNSKNFTFIIKPYEILTYQVSF